MGIDMRMTQHLTPEQTFVILKVITDNLNTKKDWMFRYE
jgi:hypothetical protein